MIQTHFRIIFKIIASIISLIAFVILTFIVVALWRNVFTYPRLEKEVATFNNKYREPASIIDLTTYRGIIHAHSYWSHDSEGTLDDILPAAKNAGISFIFLTDHPHGNIDSFPRGYAGYYDGILIEPGSEKQKLAVWPMVTTVIDWTIDNDSLVEQVVEAGGMVFYAHTEEPHDWDNPWFQGMEIYNFHTDTKDEKLLPNVINFLINGNQYRQWAMQQMFDEQTSILSRWDSLNLHRKIVGYSAVDIHENQNIRARQLNDTTIVWYGPNAKPFRTGRKNFWNRWLFSEPDSNGWVFKLMIDTYKEGFNHIVNYVVADTLNAESISQSILNGHLYSAFKSLGDAHGFIYWSENREGAINGILGDSVIINEARSLHAVSPLPGIFKLIRNGEVIEQTKKEGYEYSKTGNLKKGNYRLEIHIKLNNKLVPWLYTNPIYLY